MSRVGKLFERPVTSLSPTLALVQLCNDAGVGQCSKFVGPPPSTNSRPISYPCQARLGFTVIVVVAFHYGGGWRLCASKHPFLF